MEYVAEFQSTFEDVDIQVQEVSSVLIAQPNKPSPDLLFTVNYVLRELLNNAVEHGSKLVKEVNVKYRIIYNVEALSIDVWDKGDGFIVENSLEEINDDEALRMRKRGLSSILNMGFSLIPLEGGISAVYLLQRKNVIVESEDNSMELVIENRILKCKVNSNLISKNIKELIVGLKPYIDKTDSFDSYHMDLKEVTGIDSMGITFLIGIYKTLLAQNKAMELEGVSEPMLNLFKIMKLEEVFVIHNS